MDLSSLVVLEYFIFARDQVAVAVLYDQGFNERFRERVDIENGNDYGKVVVLLNGEANRVTNKGFGS